ncbi:MAG: hypothetical protein PUG60_07335 [Lachnospiraceae bacterium]|nr:hypothetical protein [Lachnospiraceae bacterium]
MSVSQSDVAYMRSKVNEQKRVQAHLQQELGIIESGVRNANQRMGNLQNHIYSTLTSAENDVAQSQQNLVEAYRMQGEIDKLYESFKAMEMANKKIRACNDKKYYEFGSYRTVRKIVLGFLDNLDMNMVSSDVIYKAVETEQLRQPDYWLTLALLSIMAWKEDDRELADQCIQKAVDLDKKNASVFFMLFNMRMERFDAAMKWFLFYQECSLSGADNKTFIMLFSLISKNIQDQVDETVSAEIETFINRILEYTVQSENYSEQELVDYAAAVFQMKMPQENINYPLLQKYCLEYSNLQANMMRAKNNTVILQLISNIGCVSEENMNHYLTDFINDLIQEPNTEEKIVYDEIAYNELIIARKGNIRQAHKEFKEKMVHDTSELNLIKEMVHWIYSPSNEVCDQMKLNMFRMTRPIHKMALDKITEEYRKAVKTSCPVRINDYESQIDFINPEKEEGKIKTFYETDRDQKMAEIRNTSAYVMFGAAAVSAAGALYFMAPMIFLITLSLIGIGGFIIYDNNRKKAALMEKCEKNIQNVKAIVGELVNEYRYYLGEFRDYDAYYDLAARKIDTI